MLQTKSPFFQFRIAVGLIGQRGTEKDSSLRPSHRRVATCRLQNSQGQAGILSGLARATKVARGTKALLWRAMGIPLSI
jgi:hypothetical protein